MSAQSKYSSRLAMLSTKKETQSFISDRSGIRSGPAETAPATENSKLKPKTIFKGIENERKPHLRFSPSPVPKKTVSILPTTKQATSFHTPSLRRKAISNVSKNIILKPSIKTRVPSHGRKPVVKSRFSTTVSSQNSTSIPSVRLSKLPVIEPSTSTQVSKKRIYVPDSLSESSLLLGDVNESLLGNAASPSPGDLTSSSPFQGASPIELPSSPEVIRDRLAPYKLAILEAFGYRGELFDGETEFLKDLPQLLARLDTKHYNSILSSDKIKQVKIQEVQERIGLVEVLYNLSKFKNATKNETFCVKGWADDFVQELHQIEAGETQPHKAWIRHIINWLWAPKEDEDNTISQKDTSSNPSEMFVRFSASPLREIAQHRDDRPHELFNLEDTGIELIREGFQGNEKKIITLWSDIRRVQHVVTACGRAILEDYIRRLTRWDGVEIPIHKIQERRMRYFCLKHYAYWKTAVSHYALAMKMLNLLIVFHDLWGMHIDGMSETEKKDWSVLHEHIYDFAMEFQKPSGEGEDDTWTKVECFHCFTRTAANKIENKDKDKSLWLWILHMSAVSGYGKYYAALLQIMTHGKHRSYCNEMLDVDYWMRHCSMVIGLKRIMCAVRKNSRESDLIRPMGTLNIGADHEEAKPIPTNYNPGAETYHYNSAMDMNMDAASAHFQENPFLKVGA